MEGWWLPGSLVADAGCQVVTRRRLAPNSS